MPQLNKSNGEVSSRLNKSKIGFNWTGGVKISRGKEVGGQTAEFDAGRRTFWRVH
jgi:hypothetical protein